MVHLTPAIYQFDKLLVLMLNRGYRFVELMQTIQISFTRFSRFGHILSDYNKLTSEANTQRIKYDGETTLRVLTFHSLEI